MCGIAGFLAADGTSPVDAPALVERMTTRLAHRGPDAAGTWVDGASGVALGHRRLSIVDLSPAGAQPMHSADGRWVLTYNGEVYNHVEIAHELSERAPAKFRGRSDTEVLVEAIAHWGVEEAVKRCIGMFAFAAWDRHERRLHLVRDRLGIKPLYWGAFGGALVFGSELSALKAHPAFDGEIDPDAVAAYFRYCAIPAPMSVFRRVRKLEPGTILTFQAGRPEPAVQRFWSAAEIARDGHETPFSGSYSEALDALERLLGDAVERRMIADVPLGAFLSGGIDSSLVVALMQARSKRPVKTFTIGFKEPSYDESVHARAMAQALGTDHTELLVSPAEAQAVIPELPRIYDEPFADSSMIPTFLVSRLARRQVTVALSGDGGDELMGGYNRHLWAPRVWQAMNTVPRRFRRALAFAIRSARPATWDALATGAMRFLPRGLHARLPGDKLHKLAGVLGAADPQEMYSLLVAVGAPDLVRSLPTSKDPWQAATAPDGFSFTEQMMLLDLVTYLPDDILTKVDRASMAVALEARVPLLDHRVVALAWSLPVSFRIKEGVTKAPLRDLLARFVSPSLFERPKAGFGVPVGEWVRGPLRDWAEALISPARIKEQGFLDERRVASLWRGHVQGKSSSAQGIWALLMFQAWLGTMHD